MFSARPVADNAARLAEAKHSPSVSDLSALPATDRNDLNPRARSRLCSPVGAGLGEMQEVRFDR